MTQLTRRAATVETAIASALRDLGVTENEVEVKILDSGRKGFLGFGAKDAEVLVTLIEQPEPEQPAQQEERISETELEVAEEPESELAELETKTEIPPAAVPHAETAAEPEAQEQPAGITEAKEKAYSEKEALEETKKYIEDLALQMGVEDLQVSYEAKGKYIHFQLESKKAALLIGKRGQTLNAIQQLAQLVANKVTQQFKIVRIDVGNYRERREQALEQLADRMADRAARTKHAVALEPMPSYERKVIHNALSRRMDVETYSEGKDPYRHIVIKGLD